MYASGYMASLKQHTGGGAAQGCAIYTELFQASLATLAQPLPFNLFYKF